jgi:hypothetical protein
MSTTASSKSLPAHWTCYAPRPGPDRPVPEHAPRRVLRPGPAGCYRRSR